MLPGMTTLLSEQKITSPLGTPERNTTATLRQGLTWQTLDHKPLLGEKENNCHTQKKIWHNQRQKRVIICGLPSHFAAHLSSLNAFILGQFTCQEAREVLAGSLSQYLSFNNIQSEIHSHVCFSKSKAYDTASLCLTHLVCIKQCLDSEMLAQCYCCERIHILCKLKTH